MSRWRGAKYAPNTTKIAGIFSRVPANGFGPANEAFLDCCSSDKWLGRRSDAVLDDPSRGGPSFRLHFHGHDILGAAADALLMGATSDDGVEAMPKLADAVEVLFSGRSAGSSGLTPHLDGWAAKVPSAKSYGMLDSIYIPLPEDIDDPAISALRRTAGSTSSS